MDHFLWRVNYLLETYIKDGVTVKVDAKTVVFIQLSNMQPAEYVEASLNEALCCIWVYNEHLFTEIFIERLHKLVWHSVLSYCISKINAAGQHLAHYMPSLSNLQCKSHASDTLHSTANPESGCWDTIKQRDSLKLIGLIQYHVN